MDAIIAAVSLLVSIIPVALFKNRNMGMGALTIVFSFLGMGAWLIGALMGCWAMCLGGGWHSAALSLILAGVPAVFAADKNDKYGYCGDSDGDCNAIVLLCLSACLLTSNAVAPSPKFAVVGITSFGLAWLPWKRMVDWLEKKPTSH